MRRSGWLRKSVWRLALGCLSTWSASAGLLYRTDFENFVAGDDAWVGTDGWLGNSTGKKVHGIDQDVIPGGALGKTAFIGFREPASTLVFVAKPIQYAPQAGDLPMVHVSTLLGIQDSITKTARDSFFVSIYNGSGAYLAGVRFDNRPATYGIWRADGANPDTDTGVVFYRGELHVLSFTVDLPHNQWSADLDGVPLFSNAPFTATTRAVNFGFLAYEWKLGATAVSGYGDNWMLVADTTVHSTTKPLDPPRFSAVTCAAGTANLQWQGLRGFAYQIEYSADMRVWRKDLPGSAFPVLGVDQVLSFQDVAPGIAKRFYRLRRD